MSSIAANQPSENPLLSVIIPVYNEGASIHQNVKIIADVLTAHQISFELILVDDGSADRTWSELERIAMTYPLVQIIKFTRNFGKEAALCAGLDQMRGDACVCMDADLQHPPEIIPQMFSLWKNDGYHVVEGIKKDRGKESWVYKLFALSFYAIIKKTSGIDLSGASDFRLLDKRAVEAWKKLPERQTFFRGMSSWIGFRRTRIFFDVKPRAEGSSKWSLWRLFKLALNAVTSFSAAPLYISAVLGFALIVLFFLLSIQTLYMKFYGHAESGFTTVILLQLIIGGALLLCIAVIGLYMEKIYEEVKQRPRYLIEEMRVSPNSKA